jgi:hypothetical protein
MRIHPISLALRFLKGQRTLQGAPFRGGALFSSDQAAIDVLRRLTGQDFGRAAARWGKWLRKNRWVYYASRDDPRLKPGAGKSAVGRPSRRPPRPSGRAGKRSHSIVTPS